MSDTFLRRHAAQLVAAAAVLGVYLLACSVMPKDVFWHPDEGAKFLAMQSIRWNGGLAYTVPYPGQALDPAWAFYPGRCDHRGLYPFPEPGGGVRLHWPIWFPLLSRVFYALFGLGGIYVVPLLCGWLTAVVVGQWLPLGGTSGTRAAATVLVGCASPVLFYSLAFSEHTLATLLGTLAIALLIASPSGQWTAMWAVAPLLFGSVVLRLEMLALTAALIVTWAASGMVARLWSVPGEPLRQDERATRRRRGFYAAVICFLLLCAAVIALQLTPRHWEMVLSLPKLYSAARTREQFLIPSLVNVFFGPLEFEQRLPGWVWERMLLLAMAAAVLAPFVRSRRLEALLIVPALLILFEATLLMVLASHAYLNRQGILAVAPYLIVAPYALVEAWQRRDHHLLRLAVTVGCYAAIGFGMFFLTQVTHQGQYLIGLDGAARYVLTVYPAGAALALAALGTYRRSDRSALMKSTFTILMGGLIAVAVAYQVRGLEMLYTSRSRLATWQRTLEREDPVVTDVWWLAASLPSLFTTHDLYCLPRVETFREWVAAAAERGVTNFTVASREPVTEAKFWSSGVHPAPGGTGSVDGLYWRRFVLKKTSRPRSEFPPER